MFSIFYMSMYIYMSVQSHWQIDLYLKELFERVFPTLYMIHVILGINKGKANIGRLKQVPMYISHYLKYI